MLRAIKRPREEISQNAPRLIQIQINPDKIGLVIGPGGKTIRKIQEETGAKVDIEDSGIVTLSSPTQANAFECLAASAYAAKQTRKGDLAAAKAATMVPKASRKQLATEINTAKTQPTLAAQC